MKTPECRKTGGHDWACGSLSMWCVKCWLVKPYGEMRKGGTPRMLVIPPKRASKTAEVPGVPHSKPWAKVAETDDRCCYCEEPFTQGNPPTFDHVIPRAHGGSLNDGWVLACDLCNGARGSASYEDYRDAVQFEHLLCIHEDRPYRRPKTITYGDGTQEITTATTRAIREAKLARKRERRSVQ